MDVRIRCIGNSMGIVFPKTIVKKMNFHVGDAIELDIDQENRRLIVKRKRQSLRENLLEGIKASQEDNVAFANGFDELEGEL